MKTAKRIIADYELALAEVSKVYWELTDGKLSKPNYKAEVILDEVRLTQEKEIEEAIADYKQSIIELIDEMIGKETPYYRLGIAKTSILRELKQKIEEL